MKPVPVIVTGVSVVPASTKEGATETTLGMGFNIGGGALEELPPQPTSPLKQHRIETNKTLAARFIGVFRVRDSKFSDRGTQGVYPS